ncbi:MAG: acyltransferase family protein [Porticoccaceae bacterium]
MNRMTAKAGYSYIPEIDGFRALAVLGVMAFHLDKTLLPGGFTGVDVFFVISGYVVSRAITSQGSRPLHLFLTDFFARRVVRILPALTVCLTIVAALSVLFIPQSWLSSTIARVGLWAFFGASNFALIRYHDGYFSPRAEFNPFTHTWSLGVEEQFYLLLPFVLWLWLRYQNAAGFMGFAARSALWGLSLFSLAIAAWLGHEHPSAAYYLLPSRFWELAAGVLLFMAQHRHGWGITDERHRALALAIGLLLIAAGFVYADGARFPLPWALLPVMGTLLCLAAVSQGQNHAFFHRLFRTPVAVYLGKISYSLYLWHWPVYALFRWTQGLEGYRIIPALALTLACAMLSYHAIEQPVRKSRLLKAQWPSVRVIAGLSLVACAAWLASLTYAQREALSLSVTGDTRTWYPYEYAVTTDKEQPRPLAGRKIFVVGNSHAAAYATMLREAADRLGVKHVIIQTGFCNIGNLLLNIGEEPECQQRIEQVLARIDTESSPGDLVFFASLRTYRLIDQWAAFDYGSVLPFTDEPFARNHRLHVLDRTIAEIDNLAGRAAAREGDAELLQQAELRQYVRSPYAESRRLLALDEASQLVETLAERGIQVLFDAPKPVFQMPPYRCSDSFNRGNPICALGPRVERAALLELREPVMESLETLASTYANVSLWDPFPLLCPGAVCSVYDAQGLPLFFDGDHLSAHGNRLLYPDFANILLRLWDAPAGEVSATPL